MKRRDFLKLQSGLLAASAMMNPVEMIKLESWGLASDVDPIKNGASSRLSWRAYRGTDFEGSWAPSLIEGSIPRELQGTLFRNGPGTKKIGSKHLGHFFDGDGYVTAIQIENGEVRASSKFVQTKERSEEQKAGSILYHDFGTGPSSGARGYKNNPNISVLPFMGELLALSEGGAPTLMDPMSLNSKGLFNFEGSLPKDTSFSAHPKTDPKTGDIYSFGITQSISPSLVLFKIVKNQKKIQVLNSYRLGGFYPIHDMMITENYILFVVPPLKVSLMGAAMKRAPISELIEYDQDEPLKILIFRKDGKAGPLVLKSSPSAMVYHHVNAYEDSQTGNIIFDSMVIKDASVFKVFKSWSEKSLSVGPESWITRFELDLKQKTVRSRVALSDGEAAEFPVIDPRLVGYQNRYTYALESATPTVDPLAFNQLVCWDMDTRTPHRVAAETNQVFGEPLFVPEPQSTAKEQEKAWIIHLGYDSQKDESFVDIRKAISLNLEARIWLDKFVPIGFHGQFVQK